MLNEELRDKDKKCAQMMALVCQFLSSILRQKLSRVRIETVVMRDFSDVTKHVGASSSTPVFLKAQFFGRACET